MLRSGGIPEAAPSLVCLKQNGPGNAQGLPAAAGCKPRKCNCGLESISACALACTRRFPDNMGFNAEDFFCRAAAAPRPTVKRVRCQAR